MCEELPHGSEKPFRASLLPLRREHGFVSQAPAGQYLPVMAKVSMVSPLGTLNRVSNARRKENAARQDK
jgi:hypothetical protein